MLFLFWLVGLGNFFGFGGLLGFGFLFLLWGLGNLGDFYDK